MPKTTIDLSQDRREKLEELQKQLGKDYLNEAIIYTIDLGLEKTPLLSKELTEKLNKIFIEASPTEKLNIVVDSFLKWHEKFPYLNIQREITPDDAGFPPCPLVKAVYWKGEFLGFHCRAIKPIAFRLPIMKVGSLTLQITTSKDCWECMEICKQANAGLKLFPKVSFEQIDLHKKEIKEENQTQSEREISYKLEEAGMRMSYEDVKKVFQNLHYDNEKQKWKAIRKASKRIGISHSTIYKLLKVFPKGINS
jgi:hypothetical protein